MPNKQNIQKWVDALRSGDYKQGTGRLKSENNTYCCLGVACEISELGKWENEDGIGNIDFPLYLTDNDKPAECYLPAPVRDWLGLDSADPTVNFNEEQEPLTELNDSHEITFEGIARDIERTYLNE
jgi:hypothetical protein